MSGPIKKVKFENGVPLHGTRRATFVIPGRCFDLAKFAKSLETGLKNSYKDAGWHLYEACARKFSRDKTNFDGKGLSLFARLCSGNDAYLLTEFLDTREVSIDGLSVNYVGKTFGLPGCVAEIEQDSNETTFAINHWGEGIPFDPSFLYRTGEEFGDLVKSKDSIKPERGLLQRM